MPAFLNDPVLQAGFAVLVVFTPISTAVVALRFYTAKLTKRRIGMEDWLALGALICLFLWVVFLSLMSSNIRIESDGSSTPQTIAVVNKMLFIASLMFPLNQLCAKLSILFLYYRIFGVISSYAFWIKMIGALQMIHTIENILVNIFQCVPIRKFWAPHIEGHCIHYSSFLAINESANSLIDFILAIQAVVMLRSLQADRKSRWKLSIVFAIGGLAGIIGFVKIGTGLQAGVSVGNQYLMGVWASVQMGLSIICCSVITFKPLLSKVSTLTSSISSKATLLRTRRQTHGSEPSTTVQNNKDSTWIRVGDSSDDFALNTYRSQVV